MRLSEDSIKRVYGRNRGLGKAVVIRLLEAGAAKVYACARVPFKLPGAIALSPYGLDITSAEQVNRGCAWLFGRRFASLTTPESCETVRVAGD